MGFSAENHLLRVWSNNSSQVIKAIMGIGITSEICNTDTNEICMKRILKTTIFGCGGLLIEDVFQAIHARWLLIFCLNIGVGDYKLACFYFFLL